MVTSRSRDFFACMQSQHEAAVVHVEIEALQSVFPCLFSCRERPHDMHVPNQGRTHNSWRDPIGSCRPD